MYKSAFISKFSSAYSIHAFDVAETFLICQLTCAALGFLLNLWFRTKSPCASSAEIRRRACRVGGADNQMPPRQVRPGHLESSSELGPVLRLTLNRRVPDQGHGPAAPFAPVPQHRRRAAVVVFAVHPQRLESFCHNRSRWLFKGDTVRASCYKQSTTK